MTSAIAGIAGYAAGDWPSSCAGPDGGPQGGPLLPCACPVPRARHSAARTGPGSRAWPARGSVLPPDANPGPGSSGPGPGSPIRMAARQWIYGRSCAESAGYWPGGLVHAAAARLPVPSPAAIGAGRHAVRPGGEGRGRDSQRSAAGTRPVIGCRGLGPRRCRWCHPVLQGDLRLAASCSPSADEVMSCRRRKYGRQRNASAWPTVAAARQCEDGKGLALFLSPRRGAGRGLALLSAKPVGCG